MKFLRCVNKFPKTYSDTRCVDYIIRINGQILFIDNLRKVEEFLSCKETAILCLGEISIRVPYLWNIFAQLLLLKAYLLLDTMIEKII